MRSESEIRENIEDWEQIRERAQRQDEWAVSAKASAVIEELRWVVEDE